MGRLRIPILVAILFAVASPARAGGAEDPVVPLLLGLAVVLGLVEAMGGHVRARPSDLGGLAIDIDLRATAVVANDEPPLGGGG